MVNRFVSISGNPCTRLWRQGIEHRASRTQIGRLQTFSEFVVHRTQYRSDLIATVLRRAEAGKAEHNPQLEEQSTLVLNDRQGGAEAVANVCDALAARCTEKELSLESKQLGNVVALAASRICRA
jgi:hypothetical protein